MAVTNIEPTKDTREMTEQEKKKLESDTMAKLFANKKQVTNKQVRVR